MLPIESPSTTLLSVAFGLKISRTKRTPPSMIQRICSPTKLIARRPGGACGWGTDAASMCPRRAASQVRVPPANRAGGTLQNLIALGRVGLDHLVEDELAALDSVAAVVRQRGVAVLVDVVGAEHGLPALDLEELVDHGLAVVALGTGVLDRQERDAHGLVAVDGVGLGVLAVLRLELLEEVLRRRW